MIHGLIPSPNAHIAKDSCTPGGQSVVKSALHSPGSLWVGGVSQGNTKGRVSYRYSLVAGSGKSPSTHCFSGQCEQEMGALTLHKFNIRLFVVCV